MNIFLKNAIAVCFIPLVLSTTAHTFAALEPSFEKVTGFGGDGLDKFDAVSATNDNAIIAVGQTSSKNLAIQNKGGVDATIVKYDNNGVLEWFKTWGGSTNDIFYNVIEAADGSLIAVGESNSTNAGFTNKGSFDAIIAKYKANGELQWVTNWGGSGIDKFYAVAQDSEGNFVAVGESASTNAGFSNKGVADAIIVKFTSEGTLLWQKSLGSTQADVFMGITADSESYTVVGNTAGSLLGITSKGSHDGIIASFDKNGNSKWVSTFGGDGSDKFSKILSINNEEFIVVGVSGSTNAGFINKGGTDAVVVKFDKSGKQSWVKNFGGSSSDVFENIVKTSDSSFVATGYSLSTDAGFVNKGFYDAPIVKYNLNGDIIWINSLGGNDYENLKDVTVLPDNKIVAVGNGSSTDLGYKVNGINGDYDAILTILKEEKPSEPSINISNGSIKIKDNTPIAEQNQVLYKINNGDWNIYTQPIKITYNSSGVCVLEYKSVNIHNTESEVFLLEILKENPLKDINVIFKQVDVLSISTSSNAVDFGEISGVDSVEKSDSLNLTVTSSRPYDIYTKALDDLHGLRDSTNIAPINCLSISHNKNSYLDLSKDKQSLADNIIAGSNKVHALDFKITPLIGIPSDAYLALLNFTVTQK